MKRLFSFRYLLALCCLVSVAFIFPVQSVSASKGKFYIVGMGTTPDLLTLRGARVIRDSQIVMIGGEWDKKAWGDMIKNKEIWEISHSIGFAYGVDPAKISKKDLREQVIKAEKDRKELIERIAKAVRAGKTVSALQWGDPMIYSLTFYMEIMPKDIPTEIVPGVGSFQAASAAVKMSPPYGWDTNSVILTTADFPGRRDMNRELMKHQASMIVYTMHLDYPAFFKDLNRSYPSDTPVAVVCYAGDLEKQKVIKSTVGRFMKEVKYSELPVHILMVGKFLKTGQAKMGVPEK